MKSFLRSLSVCGEFFLVLLMCFAFGIAGSIEAVFRGLLSIAPRQVAFTDPVLLVIVIYEVLALAVVVWIGHLRGWSFKTFGLHVSWKLTGFGLLLFGFAALAIEAIAVPAGMFDPARQTGAMVGAVSLPCTLFFLLTNPFFEEAIETGYFVRVLQRFGMWPAVLASACFRASLHTFFGFKGVLFLFGFGLVFALAYWQWRQLWPLVVAHLLVDVQVILLMRQPGPW